MLNVPIFGIKKKKKKENPVTIGGLLLTVDELFNLVPVHMPVIVLNHLH